MFFATMRDAICRQLTSLIVAGLFISVLSPQMSSAQSPRQTRPLRVAYLSTSATMAPLWMAKDSGALARENLDIEVLSMQSTSAIPALLANEIDVVEVSAAPVLTAALRGIDVTFVAGLIEHDDLGFLRPSRNQERRTTKRQDHRHRPPGDSRRLRNARRTEEIGR